MPIYKSAGVRIFQAKYWAWKMILFSKLRSEGSSAAAKKVTKCIGHLQVLKRYDREPPG